jgi:hypothetical protein
LKKDQLLVNGMNNEFAQKKMDFVEHALFQTRIYPNPKIVGGHKTLSQVSHETEGLRSFLGPANFHRKFIKRFWQLEKPFLDLSKKELSFEWGDDQHLWGFQNFLLFSLTCSQIWLWGVSKLSTFLCDL